MALSPPVIVFPEDGSRTSPAIDNDVVRALEEYGCFIAKYNKLEPNRRQLFEASRQIFHRLDEINADIPEFDYIRNRPYKSFGIPEATTHGTQNFITRVWPGGNDVNRNAILAYTRTAAALEEMVRKIVFARYRVGDHFWTGYIFRMTKYREVTLDFSDHEDRVEFLAVLDLNQVDGLEMKVDNQWVKIDVKPSTFLIMAGKPLKDWSNRRIHPPELRVRMHGNVERYSVGLFSYYDNRSNIDKGKDDKGTIDKGKIDKIDKGRIDKGKTEASKKQVGN